MLITIPTTSRLKHQFARHGIQETLVYDNDPQYSLEKFKMFTSAKQIEHVVSSSGYVQSNGKVESAVKIIKNILQKLKHSGTDPYLSLLDHRNTPTEGLKVRVLPT